MEIVIAVEPNFVRMKSATLHRTLRRRYDAMLAERRKQQMLVDWQVLPSENDMSWMVADVSFLKWYNLNERERRMRQ